jgi:hypothetical protein
MAPLLAPLGFVGFLVFLQVWTGSWRTWTIVERRYWQQSFDFSRQLADWLSPQYFAWHLADHDARYLTLVAGFIFLLAALHVFRAWRPPALLGWYVAGILAFCFLSSYVGPRPRMVLPAVPLFVALGDRYRGRRFVALAAVSSVGFGVMTYLAMTRAVVP